MLSFSHIKKGREKMIVSFFSRRHKEQDLLNLLGAMYSAVLFLGATNTSGVQPIVAIERTVFYRERAAGMYSALPYAFAQVQGSLNAVLSHGGLE